MCINKNRYNKFGNVIMRNQNPLSSRHVHSSSVWVLLRGPMPIFWISNIFIFAQCITHGRTQIWCKYNVFIHYFGKYFCWSFSRFIFSPQIIKSFNLYATWISMFLITLITQNNYSKQSCINARQQTHI